jgi:hypothetical protein
MHAHAVAALGEAGHRLLRWLPIDAKERLS